MYGYNEVVSLSVKVRSAVRYEGRDRYIGDQVGIMVILLDTSS